MFDFNKLRERYLNDPAFFTLVKAIESFITSEGFDPMELRQAAFFASAKWNLEHVTYKFTVEEKEETE